jgi:hypothetical protein
VDLWIGTGSEIVILPDVLARLVVDCGWLDVWL